MGVTYTYSKPNVDFCYTCCLIPDRLRTRNCMRIMSVQTKQIGRDTYIFAVGDCEYLEVYKVRQQKGKLVFGKLILWTGGVETGLTDRNIRQVEALQRIWRSSMQTCQNHRELRFHHEVLFQINDCANSILVKVIYSPKLFYCRFREMDCKYIHFHFKL